MALILTIPLYLSLFLLVYSITHNVLNRLHNLPPGPFLTFPIIGNLHLLNKPLHKNFHRLSKKYGPVFQLQLGCRRAIVVNSPSAAAECLTKSNDAVFANRPRLLTAKHFGYNYTSVTWAPYGDHWRNLRRIASVELLSSHRIQALSLIRLDEIRNMIRYLFDAAEDDPGGAVVDMRGLIFELMFNVMTRMIFGRKFYGGNRVDSDEAKEFRDIIVETHEVHGKSALDDFIPILRWIKKSDDCYGAVHRRRDKFFQDLIRGIRTRLGGGIHPEAKTIIEVLLSLHDSDPGYYTDEFVKSLTSVLLQAGNETSMATLVWAMALLVNNPDVLRKAQAEIDKRVGHPQRLINDSDLFDLPYLQCIIKETLRLYPVVPLLLPHEASRDCIVKGYRVPRGTMLMVNVWAMHHDPLIWEDPDTFKPDRLLEVGDVVEECRYLPFGAGRRGCPGEALAMRVLGTALGSLVQCFDWERMSVNMEDMSEIGGFVVSKARPLEIRCRIRSSMMNVLSQTRNESEKDTPLYTKSNMQ